VPFNGGALDIDEVGIWLLLLQAAEESSQQFGSGYGQR
jgi:hypothetical protein